MNSALWRCVLLSVGLVLVSVDAATVSLKFAVLYDSSNLSPTDKLSLRGDACGATWQRGPVLKATKADHFETVLQCDASLVDSGKVLQFKSIVNGNVWQVGPNVQLRLVSSAPNQSAWNFTSTPGFLAAQGRYEVAASLQSKALMNSRDLVVYLPPVALENPYARLPVLIMHDGQNVFNASTSFAGVSWSAADTIDTLIVDGAMEQIIVVGVYNTPDRIDEYTYVADPGEMAGGKGDLYLDFIEHRVFPWIEQNLPVRSLPLNRDDVGMLGSSLGGLISCYAGYTRSSKYSRIGCMSSSFWWDDNNFNDTIVGSKPLPASDTVFYVDSGDQEQGGCKPPQNCDDRLQSIDVRNHLASLGWVMNSTLFYFLQHGGVHNEASWAARFWVPMTSLYSPKIETI
jgi:predicted alpha/beta superfamily hydrolase